MVKLAYTPALDAGGYDFGANRIAMQVRILSPALQFVKCFHALVRKINHLRHLFCIGQALSIGCTKSRDNALAVRQLLVVVAELKLAQVAVQVLLAD